jgi:hypothetical protein
MTATRELGTEARSAVSREEVILQCRHCCRALVAGVDGGLDAARTGAP